MKSKFPEREALPKILKETHENNNHLYQIDMKNSTISPSKF